eukprot:CFRG2456T1
MSVLIETSKGDITVDLYTDAAPKSSLNFLKLCKIKYYNYCCFHNVQSNFILQTGDPSNTGKGGQSIHGLLKGSEHDFFEDEIKPNLKFTRAGLLAMANTGKNTNASQFFLTTGDRLDALDGKYTIFGEVVDDDEESMATLRAINDAYVDSDGRPYQDIRIRHTIVLDDPYPDPTGLRVPLRSPSPTPEQMQTGRIGEDDLIDETVGMTEEQIEQLKREREAKAGAQILTMIGDMPDEDVKPPDNVLFVCKLNPVTTDEDLELIFSRFGTIVSNEIIRDRKTGDSLGYAFIEFDSSDQCEAAYLKMENVLIDDRRIHVDFSQSVSKLWRQTATKSMPTGAGRGGIKYTVKTNQRSDGKQYDYVFNDDDLDKTAYKETEKRKDNLAERERAKGNANDTTLGERKGKRNEKLALNLGGPPDKRSRWEEERDTGRRSDTHVDSRDNARGRDGRSGRREDGNTAHRARYRGRERGEESVRHTRDKHNSSDRHRSSHSYRRDEKDSGSRRSGTGKDRERTKSDRAC